MSAPEEDPPTDSAAAAEEKKKTDDAKAKAKAKNEGSSAALYPDMSLAQDIHRVLRCSDLSSAQGVADKIANELVNPSLYKQFESAVESKFSSDQHSIKFVAPEELTKMTQAHETKMEELKAVVEEAKESAGDMEVMEGMVEIAHFSAQSLSPSKAMAAYKAVLDLPKLSSGKKMDCYMELARVASFANSLPAGGAAAVASGASTATPTADEDYIDKANKLAQSGSGDWDRRNRVSVYKALQCLLKRDLKQASEIMLQGIATFTCVELCTYTEFLTYAAMTNLLHLGRPLLKEKILEGPELLAIATEIPVVMKLIRSYYDCDYKSYLHAMVEVEDVLKRDRYLSAHAAYWMRELHVLAYKQFLDSYQSVTLAAMAEQFGVSVEFLDFHASQFIAAGRLSAKIDKFGGTIVTNRADYKNAQYRQVIQKGDHLLNRIQKLARVVDV
mmetsp:Transcript_20593/g.26534  ORF Transcript_20593/g.26534 Transcript_20593/m.26534 type:complete len:444 (+) Transcript_20593:49-1380(+)|eukprot:CAMPEP_0198148362 /NCGR_PEP_ID=MMETSP1443-20131203/41036_1 /TAXON_ID=186043 /ORGANISM="Entomoneis sp., Strain CCMP2396" /LENGTH=443 /DNA_ID=CAMNT_0043813031 /DNA_START=38 /DNA_END=1372 /DNA_ORIENTATION=-